MSLTKSVAVYWGKLVTLRRDPNNDLGDTFVSFDLSYIMSSTTTSRTVVSPFSRPFLQFYYDRPNSRTPFLSRDSCDRPADCYPVGPTGERIGRRVGGGSRDVGQWVRGLVRPCRYLKGQNTWLYERETNSVKLNTKVVNVNFLRTMFREYLDVKKRVQRRWWSLNTWEPFPQLLWWVLSTEVSYL